MRLKKKRMKIKMFQMIIRIKIKQYFMILMKLTIMRLINKIPNQKKNLIIKSNKLNKKMKKRKKVV